MSVENPWFEIDELHRIRQEIAAEHQYDVFQITQAARKKMELAANKSASQMPNSTPILSHDKADTTISQSPSST